jgi:hypothetical protein
VFDWQMDIKDGSISILIRNQKEVPTFRNKWICSPFPVCIFMKPNGFTLAEFMSNTRGDQRKIDFTPTGQLTPFRLKS